jgi:ribosomal-protein-alanine N-acetyltransferase
MSPVLRAAEMYDAKALARIHASCFAEAWDVEALRRFIEKPGMLALVAKDAAENDLQAFILVQIAADESEIISLATYTPARRSGLAHALLAQAIAEATRHGAKAMFLEVAEDNAAALALYHRCGFTLQARRKSYYERSGGAIDALVLRRPLP